MFLQLYVDRHGVSFTAPIPSLDPHCLPPIANNVMLGGSLLKVPVDISEFVQPSFLPMSPSQDSLSQQRPLCALLPSTTSKTPRDILTNTPSMAQLGEGFHILGGDTQTSLKTADCSSVYIVGT